MLGALLAAAVVGGVVALGVRGAREPTRCAAPFVVWGARCCAPGQRLDARGRCDGRPVSCGDEAELDLDACRPRARRARIASGSLIVGPSDWEAQGIVTPRTAVVHAFEIDVTEVSAADWRACVTAGVCGQSKHRVEDQDDARAAVLSFNELATYCASKGGRVPTDDEWTFAAMGSPPRRYPWGDTGVVCLRASFGLVDGPCAQGATGPDSIGAHALGRTPTGLFDMAGNVAEWVMTDAGGVALHGGSFRTNNAAELRGWHSHAVGRGEDRDDVGGRCVYDVPLGSSGDGH